MSHPTCPGCNSKMNLEGNRWSCPDCGWWTPNREMCPRCLAPLPEERGPGGEKVCPDCRYELWPPRDEAPPVRIVQPQETGNPPVLLTAFDARGRVKKQIAAGIYDGQPPHGAHLPEPPPLPPGPPKKGGGGRSRSKRFKRRKPLRRKGLEPQF